MSISSINEIPTGIAPFGDPKMGNSWRWRWGRMIPQRRFGDGDVMTRIYIVFLVVI
jgi:hypothetical protein